jgi:hypothetical protein
MRTLKSFLAEFKPFLPGFALAAALVLIPLSAHFLAGATS